VRAPRHGRCVSVARRMRRAVICCLWTVLSGFAFFLVDSQNFKSSLTMTNLFL